MAITMTQALNRLFAAKVISGATSILLDNDSVAGPVIYPHSTWQGNGPTGDTGGSGLIRDAALTAFSAPNLVTLDGTMRVWDCPLVSSISLPLLATLGAGGNADIYLYENPSLLTQGFPALVTNGGVIYIYENDNLTSVSYPVLTSNGAAGAVYCYSNPLLTTLSLPALATGGTGVYAYDNDSMTSLDLSAMTSTHILSIYGNALLASLNISNLATQQGGGDSWDFSVNPALTTISVKSTITLNNNFTIDAHGCALNVATVNAILTACNNGKGAVNTGTIDLSGGTSAAPTGAGITARAALQGAGITVLTNAPPSNLISENFEAANIPFRFSNSGTLHSTVNPLVGLKSLLLASGEYNPIDLLDCGHEVTCDMVFKYSDTTAGGFIGQIQNGGTSLLDCYLAGDGTLIAFNTDSSVFAQSVGATSPNTLYYLRLHYKSTTANHGEVEVFFSTTSTFPAPGSANYAGALTGSYTTDALSLLLLCPADVAEIRFDSVQITCSRTAIAIVTDGDSITIGNTPTDSWPIQMSALLGTGYRITNVAVSGQDLDSIAADVSDQVLRYVVNPLGVDGQPIYFLWEYVNQAAGSTAAQVHSKIAAICTSAKSAGFKVIVTTDFHDNTTLPGGLGQRCHDASELVRADWATYADALVDLDLPSLRTDSASGAAPGGDNIHLSTVGWGIVAGLVKTAVQSL